MKRWETWLSHISTVFVAVSGLVYLWMKYGLETDDPFAVVNHPWQSTMLSLHVLSAPFLIFVIGLITQSHIQKKLRSGKRSNRASGLVSTLMLPVMIVSGYMLQVVASPTLADIAWLSHLASSSVFVLTYVVHLVVGVRIINRSATEDPPNGFVRRQTA